MGDHEDPFERQRRIRTKTSRSWTVRFWVHSFRLACRGPALPNFAGIKLLSVVLIRAKLRHYQRRGKAQREAVRAHSRMDGLKSPPGNQGLRTRKRTKNITGGSIMKQWILVCMTVAVVFCGSAATAWADDLNPPPWERGGPGTTWQAWTFPTAASPHAGPRILNPNGTPMITITDGNWLPIEDNHVGVWQITQPDLEHHCGSPRLPVHALR